MSDSTTQQWMAASGKRDLRIIEDAAINAESAPHLLDDPITPLHRFFVRNNGTMPVSHDTDRGGWTLAVDGHVSHPRQWTLDTLRRTFPLVTVTAVLECAGNGRSLHTLPVDGLPWQLGAVGCARWTGVRLADVIAASGPTAAASDLGFLAPDTAPGDSTRAALSRGVPLAKAMSPETLICFAMNDEDLPLLHGGPLRIVAPGFPGSAWQKWLTRIWVRDREHDGEKMTGTNYRLPRSPIRPGDDLSAIAFDAITDMPVRAMITSHAPGFVLPARRTASVEGHAWSGHVPVARVEVSADAGATWQEAKLAPAGERFAWRRFSAAVSPAPGEVTLICRATDAQGRMQLLDHAPWNPRGYCNNAAHRITGRAA